MMVLKSYSILFVMFLTLFSLTCNSYGSMSTVMALTADRIHPNNYRQHYFKDSEIDVGYRDINHAMMQQEEKSAGRPSPKRYQMMQHLDVPHHFVSISKHVSKDEEPSPFSPRTLDRQLYSNVVSSRNYITSTKISIAATFILGVAMF